MPNFFHCWTAADGIARIVVGKDRAAQEGDLPGRAIRQQPFAVCVLREAVLHQQFRGDIRGKLVPAEAESLLKEFRCIGEDIAATLGVFRNALRRLRVIGSKGFAIAHIDGEGLQPVLHRLDVIRGVWAKVRDVHRAQGARGIDGDARVLDDIDRQRQRPADIDVIEWLPGGVEEDAGDAGVVVDHEGEGRLVGAGGLRLRQQRLETIGGEFRHIQLVRQLRTGFARLHRQSTDR